MSAEPKNYPRAFRFDKETDQLLEELAKECRLSYTDVLRLALQRLHQEEMKKPPGQRKKAAARVFVEKVR